jgi:hypothetical protein
LDAWSSRGTGAAVETYVEWVNPPRAHADLVEAAVDDADGDPRKAFDLLYQSLRSVASFGRLARFDYLSMLGKISLAPIEAGSPYLAGSSGPKAGAQLLIRGDANEPVSVEFLDAELIRLGATLGVGMQVLEDALCNWQKSANAYKKFAG